jgi:tight adherence protein B
MHAAAVSRRRRRRRRLVAQAPAAARALAAALRGGSSLPVALELAARDPVLDPSGRALLAQAAATMRLGARTEDALHVLARRAGPGPGAWSALVAGLLVQRRAGGDLARLLSDLAEDLELSARAAAQARSASAQARLTARIVVALPIAGALLVELVSPGAAAGVAGDPLALSLVVLALGLECGALLAVRRIARVER